MMADGGEHDYAGWLLKAAPRATDEDKEGTLTRKLKSAASSLLSIVSPMAEYKRRYFTLDGNELNYFRDDSLAHKSGSIDLGTVLDVRYADDPRLPAFAFLLVTDARTFTLAPSPASQEAAAEWFNRIAHRIETGRKRGLLARSLKSVRRFSSSGGFGGQQFGAEKGKGKGKGDKGKGGGHAVASHIHPLYLPHETCRLPPDLVLQSSINLTAAGAGGAAWSGLQPLLVGHEDKRPSGTAGGVATGTVAILNVLALEAAAKAGTAESAVGVGSAAAGAGGGAMSPALLVSAEQGEALGRRGSRVYAAPDYSAPPVTSVDPLRKDRPAMVLKRRVSVAGSAAGMPISPSLLRISTGRQGLSERLAAIAGDGPRPTSLGFSRTLGPGGAGPLGALGMAKGPTMHKRRAHKVSRWEEITGNVPRWCVSAVNDHRLKHLPLFAPVVGLGPGQIGWLVEGAASGQVDASKGSAEEYAVLGKAGAKAKKKEEKAAKKAAKAKAKARKAKAKAKAKAKLLKKKSGGGDDDDDDEEEDEEEEGDEDDSEDEADDAALAATGLKRTYSTATMGGDDDEEGGAGGGRGGVLGRGGRSAAAAQTLLKRSTRELRSRVEAMAVTSTAGGAEEGDPTGVAGDEGQRQEAVLSAAAAVPATSAGAAGSGASGTGGSQPSVSAVLPALPSGLRPGARGFELDLLLACSSKERAALAYARSQLAEHERLGWEVGVGVDDMPQQELVAIAQGQPTAAGVRLSLSLPLGVAGAGSASSSSSAAGGGSAPPNPSRLLSDTSAIADFASAAAKHASALLQVTTAAAVSGAATQLSTGPGSRRSGTASDPVSAASSAAPSRRVSEAPAPIPSSARGSGAGAGAGAGAGPTAGALPAANSFAVPSSYSVPFVSAANRPNREATRAMRTARLQRLAKGAGKDEEGPKGGKGSKALAGGHDETGEDAGGVSIRPLTGEQARAGRAFIEARNAQAQAEQAAGAGKDKGGSLASQAESAKARAEEAAQVAAKAASEPTAAPTVAARWPPGGKSLLCTDAGAEAAQAAPPSSSSSSRPFVPSEDGMPTGLLPRPMEQLGLGQAGGAVEPPPAPVAVRARAGQAPTLISMAAARAGWEAAAKEEEEGGVGPLTDGLADLALGSALAAPGSPLAATSSSPSLRVNGQPDRATRIAALRLAATSGPDARQAGAARSDGWSGPVGQGHGFDMWTVSSSTRDDPVCHGPTYGLAGSKGINSWEDPTRTHGLPAVLQLDARMHAAVFGPGVPPSVTPVLSLDPYSGQYPTVGGGGSGSGSGSGAGGLGLEPSPSSDPFEASLSYFSLHNVGAGTVLHRAQLPYGVPPATSGLGCSPLLSDNRSLFVLLHGRVRVHTAYPSGDGVARVFDSRRAWRALRGYIRVQAAFKFAGLQALMKDAPKAEGAEAGGGGAGNASARVLEGAAGTAAASPAGRGKAKGGAKGKGAAAGGAGGSGEGADGAGGDVGMCMALQPAPTTGGGVAAPGVWVEVSSVAGPVVFGAAALARHVPHCSTVVTAGPCLLLELRPAVWPRLCRAFPTVATGLGLLGSMGLHDPAALVGCVPTLVPAFAEWGAACPAGGDRWPLLASIAALFRPVVLSVGEPLWAEGDVADCAYVVVSGSVAVSVRCANTGGHTVLAVYSRGGCLGDSALACPGRRSTRAVALSSCVLLRLTHASLKALLTTRRRVWRAVRNAAAWRDAAQLVRLPLLSHLVGGDEGVGRLAPLSDLFLPVVLDPAPARPAVPGAFPRTPVDPSAALPWDVTTYSVQGMVAGPASGASGAEGGESEGEAAAPARPAPTPSTSTSSPARVSPDLHCLLLVQHGVVETEPRSGFPGATAQTFAPADWIGGGTLFTARHEGEVARLRPAVAWSSDTHDQPSPASPGFAPARSPVSSAESVKGGAVSASAPSCAVVSGIPRHQLDVFVSTLPSGPQRLKLWRDTNGKVNLVMALAGQVVAASGSGEGGKDKGGKGKGPASKGAASKGPFVSAPRAPASSFKPGPVNPLLGRTPGAAAAASGGDSDSD